jgi:hypothetical protein
MLGGVEELKGWEPLVYVITRHVLPHNANFGNKSLNFLIWFEKG